MNAATFIKSFEDNRFITTLYKYTSATNSENIALMYKNELNDKIMLVNGKNKKVSEICSMRIAHMAKGIARDLLQTMSSREVTLMANDLALTLLKLSKGA